MKDTPFTSENVREWLTENCKKWSFQVEEGKESGYKHWQVAMNLKKRLRGNELRQALRGTPLERGRFTPMHEEEGSHQYVLKADTRIDGPWSSDMPAEPREIKGFEPKPWQKTIIADAKEPWDKASLREISVLVDFQGGNGKGWLRKYLRWHRIAHVMGITDKAEEMVAMAFCMEDTNCYVFDVPRAASQNKKKMAAMWAAIEQIKDGNLFDKRFTYRSRQAETPKIWVFMNEMPNMLELTDNRWSIYLMWENRLVPWTLEREIKIARMTAAAAPAERKEKKIAHDPIDDLP